MKREEARFGTRSGARGAGGGQGKKNLPMGGIDWGRAEKIFAADKSKLGQLLETGERYLFSRETLLFLASAGAVGMSVLMPGLARVLSPALRHQQRSSFKQRVDRLRERKLVKISGDRENEPVVEITKDGVKEALQYKIEEMEIPRPARWDGKWRVVIFDIADGKKRQRDQFREKLLELDFYPLNESVYVHAFPCFDEVEFIRQIYFVGGEVQYMLVEKMEDDFALKSFYDL
jgi:hypothetical protein